MVFFRFKGIKGRRVGVWDVRESSGLKQREKKSTHEKTLSRRGSTCGGASNFWPDAIILIDRFTKPLMFLGLSVGWVRMSHFRNIVRQVSLDR